jgi:hypothetical protein
MDRLQILVGAFLTSGHLDNDRVAILLDMTSGHSPWTELANFTQTNSVPASGAEETLRAIEIDGTQHGLRISHAFPAPWRLGSLSPNGPRRHSGAN